jgi:membrane-associated phospholipid phosphatase
LTESLVVLVALLVPVVAVGAFVWRHPVRLSDGSMIARLSDRLSRARDALVLELGSVPAAIAIALAGTSVIVAVCWPMGKVAGSLQHAIDVPIFEWMQARSSLGDPLASASSVVTNMGDRLPMGIVTMVAAVTFAVLWRQRRWWVPPAVLLASFGLQHMVQNVLQVLVGGGHPPTATGIFPSGATARVVVIYGVIFYFVVLTWPRLSRRWRVVGWTVVGVVAAIEGFTRIYLVRHWPSDIPGGWVFGILLLLVMLGTASALLARSDKSTGSAP